ncbi:MAG: HNH endonuclease signature motif containing protein [Morganella morganii]|uniref:HNH endonuclease n=1 Tax=Morganella morganii TaxID=582 RepID=UPI002904DDAD|nr:HNH endonuclease [Morganella morganii]MDU0993400.1 HNH endonuclease signature motif containing protein [Morganella morganii]MDU1073817.1 HNH endonuclease signature motif containing protein [Morganella morganii]
MGFYKSEVEEHKHYESYYFCNVIKNILDNRGAFIRGLNDYYGDGRVIMFETTFPKWSHFHDFIEFIMENIYAETLYGSTLDERLEGYKHHKNCGHEKCNNEIASFSNMRNLYENFLRDDNVSLAESTVSNLERFLSNFYNGTKFKDYQEKTIKEIFYILFGNRLILKTYNEMIAEARRSDWDSVYYDGKFTTKNGYLKRVAIPKWVQKAVYYRDKGRCVFCKKDLTGLINIYNKSNYDHIVPLAMFGINDVSNIQLLCESCNKKKNSNNCESSNDYFPWYTI